jgi:hypothetical protein
MPASTISALSMPTKVVSTFATGFAIWIAATTIEDLERTQGLAIADSKSGHDHCRRRGRRQEVVRLEGAVGHDGAQGAVDRTLPAPVRRARRQAPARKAPRGRITDVVAVAASPIAALIGSTGGRSLPSCGRARPAAEIRPPRARGK